MKILEFKYVNKEYCDGEIRVKALKNINLELHKGEFVAIVGPSGCGKSTLLNLITKLHYPSSGDIFMNGDNLLDYNRKQWNYILQNEIGFIYQYYELIDCLNVNDNIKLKLNDKNGDRYIDEMLTKLDLSEYKYQSTSLLSGGQRQRVGVIRALANNPSLILADEPTGALDYNNSELLLSMLQEYSNNSLVIMVTHNEKLARKYVSKIIYMEHGDITRIEVLKETSSANSKNKIKKEYCPLSIKLGLKYIFLAIKTIKVRFMFLIGSGCFIFLFIAILLSSLATANNYIDNQYMFSPLYNVFDLITYYENDGEIKEAPISKDMLPKLINKYDNCVVRENIDKILKNYIFNQINFEEKKISNCNVKCLGGKLDNNSFSFGRNITNINEIIISESLAKLLLNDDSDFQCLLGKNVDIKEVVKYKVEYEKEFKVEIVGIVKDSILNHNNDIYVDYALFYNMLKNSLIDNKITYFDALYTYDYQLVINDIDRVNEVITEFKNNPYYRDKENIPSHSYHFSFANNIAYEEKEMFSELLSVISLLVYFFIILGLVIFMIFIGYVLSSFVLEKRKDYAIFEQLGIRRKDMYILLIIQALIIALLMIILGLLVLIISVLIVSLFEFPFRIIVPYIPLLVQTILFILLCIGASILPINNLRKMEMGSVLKSE